MRKKSEKRNGKLPQGRQNKICPLLFNACLAADIIIGQIAQFAFRVAA
jgi:hypothetical protein